ncbi:MAG: hypothetical protein OYH76_20160 [Defluviicoccus sp.]|nr:hypothetical protein [Defluviicoccus sp.]MDE0278217.1 hypothetical protein [Defluviicoccus sp.]
MYDDFEDRIAFLPKHVAIILERIILRVDKIADRMHNKMIADGRREEIKTGFREPCTPQIAFPYDKTALDIVLSP